MLSLTPKNTRFFDLLEDSGGNMCRIADLLKAASSGEQPPVAVAESAIALRDDADHFFEQYVGELHDAFVTPIDRDDLYQLGFELDKLIEAMERLANRWVTYDLPPTEKPQIELVARLHGCCDQAAKALPLLRRRGLMGGVGAHFREIRHLGRAAEETHRAALKALCQEPESGLKQVLRKELLDLTMIAVHACQRLADALHKAVIRNV